jgi:hypothetical protein
MIFSLINLLQNWAGYGKISQGPIPTAPARVQALDRKNISLTLKTYYLVKRPARGKCFSGRILVFPKACGLDRKAACVE